MVELMKCEACGREVSSESNVCRHCGHPLQRQIQRLVEKSYTPAQKAGHVLQIVGFIMAILGILFLMAMGKVGAAVESLAFVLSLTGAIMGKKRGFGVAGITLSIFPTVIAMAVMISSSDEPADNSTQAEAGIPGKETQAKKLLEETAPAPEVGDISMEQTRAGCNVYAKITPKESGFEHRVEVKFVFKDKKEDVLHMMPWTINHPVAGKTEIIKGWWHRHRCKDFDTVEVTAQAM
jgi:hypothetical protein